jgi:hypothetical protein
MLTNFYSKRLVIEDQENQQKKQYKNFRFKNECECIRPKENTNLKVANLKKDKNKQPDFLHFLKESLDELKNVYL